MGNPPDFPDMEREKRIRRALVKVGYVIGLRQSSAMKGVEGCIGNFTTVSFAI